MFFAKLGLAAVVGTLATTAFAAPASAHEYRRERVDWYGRHREMERRERWEHARREAAWRHREWNYLHYGW
ncbi:MAG TPA: hypothetical protein VFF06_01905 [Polyangia bacterium]|nr:hypothetical protein [Polyangia bacterium]